MPSKRKKNKRRMRRAQAQRRALEEQHANSPPVKASARVAACTPPGAAPKKAPKTRAPAAGPAGAPMVETPKEEPQPCAEPQAALVEAAPAEAEVRAGVSEETAAPSAPSAEAADVERVAAGTEVSPPAEAPMAAAAESDTVDGSVTTTQAEQPLHSPSHVSIAEKKEPEEEEGVPEVEVKVEASVKDDAVPEPVTEEPVTEVFNIDPVSADAQTVVAEPVEPDKPGPERATGAVRSVVEALVERDAAGVSAEPQTLTQVSLVQSVQIPVVQDNVSETLVEKAESVSAVKEHSATSDVQTDPEDVAPAGPQPAAAPADAGPSDAEQTSQDLPPEERESEAREAPRQTQLTVESAQLVSAEPVAEATVNGHVVAEVSTEG